MDPSRFTAALTSELKLRGVAHTWEEVNQFVKASWPEIKDDLSVSRWADEYYESTREPEPGSEPQEEDDRPWESPGAVRHDYESHRGPILIRLGMIAAVGGLTSIFCLPCAPINVIVGLVTWWLARQDMEQIEQGLMHPDGRVPTESAIRMARFGSLLSIGALVVWSIISLAIVDIFRR